MWFKRAMSGNEIESVTVTVGHVKSDTGEVMRMVKEMRYLQTSFMAKQYSTQKKGIQEEMEVLGIEEELPLDKAT